MLRGSVVLGKAKLTQQLSQKEQDFIVKTAFQKPDEARGQSSGESAEENPGLMPCDGRWADSIAGGITLSGFKFMTIKADDEEVVGRKGVSCLI